MTTTQTTLNEHIEHGCGVSDFYHHYLRFIERERRTDTEKDKCEDAGSDRTQGVVKYTWSFGQAWEKVDREEDGTRDMGKPKTGGSMSKVY
jgi:hypothetical protein